MSKSIYFPIQLDENGHLILPPKLLAEYGIVTGAQVRLDESATGFSISRSSDNLARVYIEPTNMCNLDCATCMRHAWDELPGKMSQSTFENIMLGIRKINPRPSIFFGGFGEPLTHPHIVDMVGAAKQVGSSVELISNGILLTPEIILKFIELGLNRLWISLDGATPESYADVRLGDALPLVLKNLKTLQKMLRTKEPALPKLGIAFVAMRRNVRDLPEIIDLGKKLGADMFSISNVLPHTPEMLQDALYVGPHNGNVMVSEWSPLLLMPRMDLNEFTMEPILEAVKRAGSLAVTRQDLHLGANVCPFVEKGSVSIRWDGAVSPCLALLHDNDNYLDFRKRKSLAYSIANINQRSLLDTWHDPDYAALRQRLLTFDFSFCTFCNSCEMADANLEDCFGNSKPSCGGCLWAQGLIQCP